MRITSLKTLIIITALPLAACAGSDPAPGTSSGNANLRRSIDRCFDGFKDGQSNGDDIQNAQDCLGQIEPPTELPASGDVLDPCEQGFEACVAETGDEAGCVALADVCFDCFVDADGETDGDSDTDAEDDAFDEIIDACFAEADTCLDGDTVSDDGCLEFLDGCLEQLDEVLEPEDDDLEEILEACDEGYALCLSDGASEGECGEALEACFEICPEEDYGDDGLEDFGALAPACEQPFEACLESAADDAAFEACFDELDTCVNAAVPSLACVESAEACYDGLWQGDEAPGAEAELACLDTLDSCLVDARATNADDPLVGCFESGSACFRGAIGAQDEAAAEACEVELDACFDAALGLNDQDAGTGTEDAASRDGAADAAG